MIKTLGFFCAIAVFALADHGAVSSTPNASITVSKGYDKGAGLGTGTAQFYDFNSENVCKGRKRIYKFSAITGRQNTKDLPAGNPIYVMAYVKRYTPGYGINLDVGTCRNTVSFTPKAGENYQVRQQVIVGQSCSFSVIAHGTGAPPPDLREVDALDC